MTRPTCPDIRAIVPVSRLGFQFDISRMLTVAAAAPFARVYAWTVLPNPPGNAPKAIRLAYLRLWFHFTTSFNYIALLCFYK